MALRSLLFTSDEGVARPISQVLKNLGIAAEYCPAAPGAIEKIASEVFHLIIVDWDNQPEAGFLLQAARERKAAERPLTLAIVSKDANVPQALQGGANSILRKPLLENQVRDTLTMAHGLLRTRFETAPAQAAAASAAAGLPAVSGEKKSLRSGEFLPSAGTGPSKQYEAQPEKASSEQSSPVAPAKELEPLATAVEDKAERPATRPDDKPRGLSDMKTRGGTLPPVPRPLALPDKPEVLTYQDVPAPPRMPAAADKDHLPAAKAGSAEECETRERKAEDQLVADPGRRSSGAARQTSPKARPWIRKAVLTGALVLTGVVAHIKVPGSLWRQNIQILAAHVFHAGHNWLNPQPVTPPQPPTSHENFGRAGDEYKLPVAENIPDATTDPAEIRVLPVIDPTAKPANNTGSETPPDTSPIDRPSEPPVQVQENPSPQTGTSPSEQTGTPPTSATAAPGLSTTTKPAPPDPFKAATAQPAVQPAPQKNPHPAYTPTSSKGGIPSSLKSHMASTTPEASGNKPVEAAMPSIEPVELPEASARALLQEAAEPAYPENANGKQGNTVLQVLIGRDGSVQDAKFLQGSLVFARSAIDAVKQWRFKPYILNGRPVSVQTILTVNFKPGA